MRSQTAQAVHGLAQACEEIDRHRQDSGPHWRTPLLSAVILCTAAGLESLAILPLSGWCIAETLHRRRHRKEAKVLQKQRGEKACRLALAVHHAKRDPDSRLQEELEDAEREIQDRFPKGVQQAMARLEIEAASDRSPGEIQRIKEHLRQAIG